MVSQKNHASAAENFGKQTERKVGYDLPKDLEPWRRFAYELGDLSDWSISTSSSSSSSSETLGLVYSSKYKDLVFRSGDTTALQSVSSKGVERTDVPQALVIPNLNPNLIDIVKNSDYKASESHEELVPVSPPKGYKRRKGVMVVRDFPLVTPNPKTIDIVKNSDDKASESHEEVVPVSPPKDYKLRKGVTVVRDFPLVTPNPKTIDVVKNSDDKASESHEEVVPVSPPKGYKLRKGVTVVRDFPLVTPNPKTIDIVKNSDDIASESHEELVPVSLPKGYKRRKGVTVVRDFPLVTPNPKTIDIVKISDDKGSESHEEVVPVSPPKGYKPRKGVTAVRDFPVPQRNFQTRFSEDLLQAVVPDGFRYFYKSRSGITVVRDFPFPRFQTPSSEVLVQAVAAESSPSYDSESEKELESIDSSPSYDSEFKYELESTKAAEEEEVTSKYEDKESTKETELGLTDTWYDFVQSGDSIMSMYRLTSEEEEIDMSKGMDFVGSEDQLSETSKNDSTDLTWYVDTPNGYRKRGSQIMDDAISKATSFELDSEGYSRISCKKVPNTTEKPVPKRKATICHPYNLRKRDIKSNTNMDTTKRRTKNH